MGYELRVVLKFQPLTSVVVKRLIKGILSVEESDFIRFTIRDRRTNISYFRAALDSTLHEKLEQSTP